MATPKSEDDDTVRRRLVARQENSRRLPDSENLDETTLMVLDGSQATDSGPSRPADQLTLPSVTVPTSYDEAGTNVLPARTDEDRSSLKSEGNRASAGVIPARLPALDVRHSSKDDVRTTDEETAPRELGSVESIRMDVGSQSGKLEHNDAAWTNEKHDITTNDETETVSAAKDIGDETAELQEDESKYNEDTETSTDKVQQDEVARPLDTEETVSKDAEESRREDIAVPLEKTETPEDSSVVQSPTDVETQQDVPAAETPGENDSGVNVEDVHNDEPTATDADYVDNVIQPSSEIPAVEITSFGDGSSLKATPRDDDPTSSPSRQLNARQQLQGDGDRLAIPRSPNFPGSERRRSSSFDPKQLRQNDEGLIRSMDQNKPRLLALAQKGEWSVLDQILRAMERSSFYEINLADEVCTGLPLKTSVQCQFLARDSILSALCCRPSVRQTGGSVKNG